MKIIFMGSAAFACPALDAIRANSGDTLVAAVTKPDRPQGRHLEVHSCPVKAHLAGHGATVLTPEDVNAPESVAAIRALAPDLIVVVAYGQMLKPAVLQIPPAGVINLHASLLPKYRGAAPIAWAIANGDPVTGVTTMHVNERMDAGDIILQREVAIAPDDTGGVLHDRLAHIGADLLRETISMLQAGCAPRRSQNEAWATRAPKLAKSAGRIDWRMPAAVICNRVRAFQPWPGSFFEMPRGSGRLMRVGKAQAVDGAAAEPGTITVHDGALTVAAGQGGVRVLEIQPEGRTMMAIDVFLRGNPVRDGTLAG